MNIAKFRRIIVPLVFLIGFLPVASHPQSKPAADLIIQHAKIWTVDAANPMAQAVAVLRDRIVAVGTDTDVGLARPQSTSHRRCGKLLLPGFNDAHCHFLRAGCNWMRLT
jgi:predicted amidohydrolase YtcJ